MKHNPWTHHLIGAVFAFILAVSSVGNLITAYELPVEAMWKLYLWCAFAAIAISALFRFPKAGKIAAAVTALAVLMLCLTKSFQQTIQAQFEALCYCISSHCHAVYNWPVLGAQSANDVAIPLIFWGILVALCVNWYVCKGKYLIAAIVPAILPLTLCLLTADKVPHPLYLFGLFLGLSTLLITDWTRKHQPQRYGKLVLWCVLPIALAFGLVFLCNPETNYVNRAGKLQKEISILLEEIQDAAEAVMTGSPIDTSAGKNRNLLATGERSQSTRPVMLVNAPISETLYLRERDFDIYTGAAWEATTGRSESFTPGTKSVGTLTILTYSTRGTLFVPYYATSRIAMTGGALENEQNLQQYTYQLSPSTISKTSVPDEQYTELPDDTMEWAKKLATKVTRGATTNEEKIIRIQKYVRRCALYDASTGQMDPSYDDFALWFLEESPTGYCIHYATVTTILLRACNIPARYVEGYIVNAKKGTDVVVSKQDAHAWVEYYDWVSRAWYILEATPGYQQMEKPEVRPGVPQGSGITSNDSKDPPSTDATVEDPSTTKPPAHIIATLPSSPEETKTPGNIEENPTTQTPGVAAQNGGKWLKFALIGLVLILSILLQGWVRISRKRKLWNCGKPNTLALWRWRYTHSLAKQLKQAYPEELDALAQKARFSQHELQSEELEKFEDYRLTLITLIGKKPWYQKAFFKWILGIA